MTQLSKQKSPPAKPSFTLWSCLTWFLIVVGGGILAVLTIWGIERLTFQPRGEIVYVCTIRNPSPDLSFQQICTMNADGGSRKILTNFAALVSNPRWLSDGERISFQSHTTNAQTGSTQAVLYVMNADGSNPEAIPGAPADAVFSPDGQWLAFTRPYGEEQVKSLSIIKSDGSGLKRLTTTKDSDPVWSPDGQSIAYTSDDGTDERLFVIKMDGSAPRQISRSVAYTPQWSFDGQEILFDCIVDREQGMSGFCITNATTLTERMIEAPKGFRQRPTWSPDGKYIVYQFWDCFICWNTPDVIGVMRIDGSGHTQISSGNHDASPSWRPPKTSSSFTLIKPIQPIELNGQNKLPPPGPSLTAQNISEVSEIAFGGDPNMGMVYYSHSEKLLLSTTITGVIAYDSQSLVPQWFVDVGVGVSGSSFSQDETLLAVATDIHVFLFDVVTSDSPIVVQTIFNDTYYSIWGVALAANSTTSLTGTSGLVATASGLEDGRGIIKLWDIATGNEVQRFAPQSNIVRTVGFLPDGKSLISQNDNGEILVSDIAKGQALVTIVAGEARSLSLSSDGTLAIVTLQNSIIMFVDTQSGRPLPNTYMSLDPISEIIYSTTLSPNGQILAAISYDHIKLLDFATLREINRISISGGIPAVIFSKDGQWLITSSYIKATTFENGVPKEILIGEYPLHFWGIR